MVNSSFELSEPQRTWIRRCVPLLILIAATFATNLLRAMVTGFGWNMALSPLLALSVVLMLPISIAGFLILRKADHLLLGSVLAGLATLASGSLAVVAIGVASGGINFVQFINEFIWMSVFAVIAAGAYGAARHHGWAA